VVEGGNVLHRIKMERQLSGRGMSEGNMFGEYVQGNRSKIILNVWIPLTLYSTL